MKWLGYKYPSFQRHLKVAQQKHEQWISRHPGKDSDVGSHSSTDRLYLAIPLCLELGEQCNMEIHNIIDTFFPKLKLSIVRTLR